MLKTTILNFINIQKENSVCVQKNKIPKLHRNWVDKIDFTLGKEYEFCVFLFVDLLLLFGSPDGRETIKMRKMDFMQCDAEISS